VKIAPTAATLPVLSPKTPQWLPALACPTAVTTSWAGNHHSKSPTAAAWNSHSEWVCFEHQGYARQKAADWWRKRAPGLPVPLSVDAAIAQASRLARPSEISVGPSGRYFEISGYRFDPCAKPTPAFALSATGNLAALAGSIGASASRTEGETPVASSSAALPAKTSATGGRA